MTYWDSSAIIPLLLQEPTSARYMARARKERITTWWASSIECVSGISRREREGTPAEKGAQALRLLVELESNWTEIQPSERVRRASIRLLKHHALRSSDALHLAAAMVATNFDPTASHFLTEDVQLRRAAAKEGFLTDHE